MKQLLDGFSNIPCMDNGYTDATETTKNMIEGKCFYSLYFPLVPK